MDLTDSMHPFQCIFAPRAFNNVLHVISLQAGTGIDNVTYSITFATIFVRLSHLVKLKHEYIVNKDKNAFKQSGILLVWIAFSAFFSPLKKPTNFHNAYAWRHRKLQPVKLLLLRIGETAASILTWPGGRPSWLDLSCLPRSYKQRLR
jgi:hypothetical protein